MDLYANSVLEAEEFVFDAGFFARPVAFASGNGYVQSGTTGLASMHATVENREGTYDLAVTYFDETDGESWSRVLIDGEIVDTWNWDATAGSRLAGPGSEAVRIIRDVTLDDMARITIEGMSDRGEPLRIDKVQLQRSRTLVEEDDNLAFAQAEGFGAVTQGGRGGIVIHVTNLADAGEGSLRWALEGLDFPRIVVFDVGGLIRLSDQIEVNGDVTVAGQTAPGGITVTGARLRVVESDVIIQGLRIRPGDGPGQDPRERDGITIGTSDGRVERVILDSNSFTWAVDENISIWSGARDVTISNNVIAEGLNDSIHPQGTHSMGMLIGAGVERVTIADNLFANNVHRNPQLTDTTKVEFVNNLVSNWGNNGFHTAIHSQEPIRAHVIGNVFVEGDYTSTIAPVRLRGWEDGTKYVIRDNLGPGRDAGDPETWILQSQSSRGVTDSGTAFRPSNVSVQASEDVLDHIRANVGARTDGALDAIDRRILSEIGNGGAIVDSPPERLRDVATGGAARADRDRDGIPDAYEIRLGSDPGTYDPHGDANGDGWLNIEEYFRVLLEAPDGDPPGGKSPAGPPGDVTVQAEDMELVSGFRIRSNGQADGKRMIQASSEQEQVARTSFNGPDGTYDIVLHYWDETDGQSNLSVELNGDVIDTWIWNSTFGNAIANDHSATTRRISGINIDQGDEVILRGYADEGEPLRIDYIEFDTVLG